MRVTEPVRRDTQAGGASHAFTEDQGATMPHMQSRDVTTAEQLLELREPGHRHELVRGELRRMSASGWWHGVVVGRLAEFLGNHVRTSRAGHCMGAETGFVLARNPDSVRAPDVAFVRTERLPATYAPGFFPGPPDLAVEATSPTDAWDDVQEKVQFWLAHGTTMVWVVEPRARRITVYRSAADVRVLGHDDVLDGGPLLPAFRVPVADVFPPPSA